MLAVTLAVAAVACSSGGSPDAGGVSKTCSGGACEWADWPMPNPPSSGLPNPASYDTSTPGVVLDRVTGLMWQRDVKGRYDWAAAKTYCTGLTLAGHSDWRLPTEVELFSLVDFTVAPPNPTLDATAFPDTATEPMFWSSLPASGGVAAWGVSFQDGTADYQQVTNSQQVRCVRGPSASIPPAHYTIAGGTVTDNFTRLVWQQAANTAGASWAGAKTYCAGLTLAGGGWRVPSMKELMTLVDWGAAYPGPTVDATAFPDTPNVEFWSSSHVAGNSPNAWGIFFWDGHSGNDDASNSHPVRCVR